MKEILVLREFDKFTKILRANNFQTDNLPLIETQPVEDLTLLERAFERGESLDGIFLTSSKAARILFDNFSQKLESFEGKIYILGRSSFEILQVFREKIVFFETADTALELLESIPRKNLESKNFLFVRGSKSLGIVPEFLGRFSKVDELIVYRTRKIEIETDKIKLVSRKLKNESYACACFFSPSAGESFLEQFGEKLLHQTPFAVIGKTTADFFKRRNLQTAYISPKSSAEDFAKGLIKYLQYGKRKMENGK